MGTHQIDPDDDEITVRRLTDDERQVYFDILRGWSVRETTLDDVPTWVAMVGDVRGRGFTKKAALGDLEFELECLEDEDDLTQGPIRRST